MGESLRFRQARGQRSRSSFSPEERNRAYRSRTMRNSRRTAKRQRRKSHEASAGWYHFSALSHRFASRRRAAFTGTVTAASGGQASTAGALQSFRHSNPTDPSRRSEIAGGVPDGALRERGGRSEQDQE